MLETLRFVSRNSENTHWDIYQGGNRIYRIRGDKGKGIVICSIGESIAQGTIPNCVKYIFEDIYRYSSINQEIPSMITTR